VKKKKQPEIVDEHETEGRVLAPGEYDGIQLAEELGLFGKSMYVRLYTGSGLVMETRDGGVYLSEEDDDGRLHADSR